MRDPGDTSAPCGIGRLRRRADFLRVAAGKRWHAGAMTVQAAPGGEVEAPARVGFTLTLKVGSAVVRNRVRRRLKEALRLAPDLPVRHGHDYVIVGRIEALRMPFTALQKEVEHAVRAVHEAGRSGRPRPKDKRRPKTSPSKTSLSKTSPSKTQPDAMKSDTTP